MCVRAYVRARVWVGAFVCAYVPARLCNYGKDKVIMTSRPTNTINKCLH